MLDELRNAYLFSHTPVARLIHFSFIKCLFQWLKLMHKTPPLKLRVIPVYVYYVNTCQMGRLYAVPRCTVLLS